ncbi:MAG: sigma-70 family RNA polymerase sigma factor [Ruminococcus sp.]|nr:sigma-70 family RNA polymerase sigma factor [Ruminococcus sp.]
MDDESIIGLYFERDEKAVSETSQKYGALCTKIAMNVLADSSESEEVVSDTYLKAWNTIPPQKPKSLGAYLSVIARNLALDRYRKKKAAKRIDGSLVTTLDEVAQILPDSLDIEQLTEQRQIVERINAFLGRLPTCQRVIFVRRYFYLDSIKDISQRYGLTESSVTVTLTRIRKKLAAFLEKEGML